MIQGKKNIKLVNFNKDDLKKKCLKALKPKNEKGDIITDPTKFVDRVEYYTSTYQ